MKGRLGAGPDRVSVVLSLLERSALPVVAVGIARRVGSVCPLCGTGMCVSFSDHGIAFECARACREADIWAAIGGQS